MFPGVSSAVSDVYVEYVPCPVPRGPRSVGKRGLAESSSGLSSAKKSRQSSTRPGTLVVASMLLGEHINTLCLFVFCFLSLTEYFCPFSAGALATLVESEEEEDNDAALVTRR